MVVQVVLKKEKPDPFEECAFVDGSVPTIYARWCNLRAAPP